MIYLPCISSLYLVYHDISTLCIISVSYDLPSCIDIYLVYHDIYRRCVSSLYDMIFLLVLLCTWYIMIYPHRVSYVYDMTYLLIWCLLGLSWYIYMCIIPVWYDLPSSYWYLLGISLYIFILYHPCMIWPTFSYWYLLGISWYIYIVYHVDDMTYLLIWCLLGISWYIYIVYQMCMIWPTFWYVVYLVYHFISTSCIIPAWYDLPSLLMSTWYIMIHLHCVSPLHDMIYLHRIDIYLAYYYISSYCIIPVWYDLPSRIAVKGAPSSCWSRISFNAITWLVNLKGKRLLWIFSVCINVVCIKWPTGFLEIGLTIKHLYTGDQQRRE